MSRLAVNGESLHVATRGEGRAVVFLHSLGLDSDAWETQVAALPGDVRSVAIDLRGHGRSTAHGKLTVPAMAQDVAAILDSLGVARATLVGCSMGGLVAQGVVTTRPDRVEALLLCNTFARMDPADAARRVAARQDQAARGVLTPERRAEVLVADAPERSRELFLSGARRMLPEHMFAVQEAVYGVDFTGALSAVDCPVQIISGSEDERTPQAMLDELASAIPGARVQEIDGAGHVSHLDRPREFNAALLSFLRRTSSLTTSHHGGLHG